MEAAAEAQPTDVGTDDVAAPMSANSATSDSAAMTGLLAINNHVEVLYDDDGEGH